MNYRKTSLLLGSIALFLASILIPTFEFLIWFAFVPLLIAIHQWPTVKSVLGGLAVGILFFAGLLYWITYYELRIFVIVISLVTPFFGLFALFTKWISRKFKNEVLLIFAPPIAWSAVAFLYSLTPLEIIGDQIAFIQAPLFPGIVRLTGISGITFLILLANSLIARWLIRKDKTTGVGIFAMALILMLGVFSPAPVKTNPIKVALIQHNFPIPSDWRFIHRKDVIITYEKAIRDLGSTVDLIVFPQYGLPIDVLREPQWLNGLAKLANTSILLGTYIPKLPGGKIGEGEQFDTALLFSPQRAVQDYRAMTPPPFRKIGQIRGTKRAPLFLDNTKIGVMLCYEDTRPREGKMWIKNGAEILVALSNPGHFLGTPLPRYHLLHDRIRAIETGRYVIRASPNGFSAIIDPKGKILTQSKLSEEKILKGVVYPLNKMTPFAKSGTLLPPISFLLSLILLLWSYGRDSMKRLARKIR